MRRIKPEPTTDKLMEQFRNLRTKPARRAPQMHPTSRVYESAAAKFAKSPRHTETSHHMLGYLDEHQS